MTEHFVHTQHHPAGSDCIGLISFSSVKSQSAMAGLLMSGLLLYYPVRIHPLTSPGF